MKGDVVGGEEKCRLWVGVTVLIEVTAVTDSQVDAKRLEDL